MRRNFRASETPQSPSKVLKPRSGKIRLIGEGGQSALADCPSELPVRLSFSPGVLIAATPRDRARHCDSLTPSFQRGN